MRSPTDKALFLSADGNPARISRAGWLRLAGPLAGLLFLLAAFWQWRQPLQAFHYAGILPALHDIAPGQLWLAVLLTAAGYLALVGYDLLAFRFIRRPIPLRSLAAASFVASAFSFNLGSTALTGAAIRAWLYRGFGLSGGQLARIAVFCGAGFWLGYFFLAALAFIARPIALPAGLDLPWGSTRPLGEICLALLAAYVVLTRACPDFRLGVRHVELPSPTLTLRQIMVASLDLSLMAATLYVLLPPLDGLGFLSFLPMFLAALVGGSASQVPGGLGVFETAMLLLLAPYGDPEELAAGLIAFRLVYYVLPLCAAAPLALRYGLRRTVDGGGAGLEELERARCIAEASPHAYASLALRGDKALLFSRSGRSFLMYGRHGRSWIAMGDPVGPAEERAELVGRFRDLAAAAGGRCIFFEVGEESRALYAGFGLAMTPIGREARLRPADFSLAAPGRKALRHNRNRLRRRGAVFSVLPPAEVPAVMPALRRISDAWLAGKATREKEFASASFDPAYISRFPIAVVWWQGEIIAFANLWQGAGREELSFDLMRYHPQAPHGTMDFLFTELILWARDAGYRWFTFGLAPLAGVEPEPGGPWWPRVACWLRRVGQPFYHFDGLARYKGKFGPAWTPLYVASPGGAALVPVIIDCAALMAGGLPGIFAKGPGGRRMGG